MNYGAHYDRLIARARSRTLTGYRERHHVVPRCMGGGDEPENLVNLTPEEHYVAHQLLVKMHPGNKGLVHAAFYMAKQCTGNKAFGWLRRRKSEAMRGHKMHLGRKWTDEQRARASAQRRGKKRQFTPEWRANVVAAIKRRPMPSTRGYTFSAESRAKMSAAARGRVFPREALEKAAAATRARWQRYREAKAAC